jgi:hypothetical protein
MAETAGPMKLTVGNILLGVACIVVANLLLVALRMVVDIPLSDGLESAIATGIGVVAWFYIAARMKR